jgi:4-hydroxy-2-oxoglutarate aldolase
LTLQFIIIFTDRMSQQHSIAPPRGIYTPVTAFFLADESLDTDALQSHILRLAAAGVRGLVIHGSNGEAPHLTHAERTTVISTVRKTLVSNGFQHIVIIAGCGAQSTRETVQLCTEAEAAGAQWALILSPSYWSMLFFTTAMNRFE